MSNEVRVDVDVDVDVVAVHPLLGNTETCEASGIAESSSLSILQEARVDDDARPPSDTDLALLWGFIRKVYSIFAVQILATFAVTAGVVANPSVAVFFLTTWGGWATYAAIVLATKFFVLFLKTSVSLDPEHPINFIALAIFTVCVALLVGISASYISARIVYELATATFAVVATLILYTFWAQKRRYTEFRRFSPIFLTLLVTPIIFDVYRIFFWAENMLPSGIYVVLFSIYMMYETNALVSGLCDRLYIHQYIWASVLIYVDFLVHYLSYHLGVWWWWQKFDG